MENFGKFTIAQNGSAGNGMGIAQEAEQFMRIMQHSHAGAAVFQCLANMVSGDRGRCRQDEASAPKKILRVGLDDICERDDNVERGTLTG